MASASAQEFPEYPFASHYVVVDGHRMHYLDEGPRGEGVETVVLLHGNPTWSYYYRHLITALRADRRVIAPDWIGCGLSDHPANAHYRASDRIEHLRALLAHCGVTRCSLVMHDWGGPIGTGFAGREPERIDRLIYLNTTLTETESLPLIIKNAARPLVGKVLTKYTRHFVDLTTSFGVVHPLSKEIRAAYAAPYMTAKRRTAVWDFVADIPFDADHPSYVEMLSMADQLPHLRHVPVQIIWGLKDPCFHREMLSKVAAHFPHASVLEIANASHLVLEDAREVVIRTIEGFLAGVPGGESRTVRERDAEGFPGPATTTRHPTGGLYGGFQDQVSAAPKRRACVMPRFPIELSAPGAVVEYRHYTFEELHGLICKYERGLREIGLERGDRVVMLVPPGAEFLALSFAVMGRGAVPVFLDPGMGREKLLSCIRRANARGLIASPRALLLRWVAKDIYRSFAWKVFVTDLPLPGVTSNGFFKRFAGIPLPAVEVASQDPALVAFTSGATGTPKGVVFTRGMLEAQLGIFSSVFGLTHERAEGEEIFDLPLLPIFSLFSVSLGIGSVFPPVDPARPLALDPQKVVRILTDLPVRFSFGSPTLWNKIAEYCVRSATTLPGLKRIFMAGAPVPVAVLHRVREVTPHGESFTPYGATEALPITCGSGQEILAREQKGSLERAAECGAVGTYVGAPVEGVELKIVERTKEIISDLSQARELRAWQIGEVLVRGQNVSASYLEDPEATVLAKVPVAGGEFWHRMGDVGYLDDEGALYFCGRVAHVVEIEDRTYYSIPCERVLNADPRVRRSALVHLKSRNEAALVVELHPHAVPRSEVERSVLEHELLARAAASPLTAEIRTVLMHPSFPVDARHNAKIFRDQLGEWADQEVRAGRGGRGVARGSSPSQKAA